MKFPLYIQHDAMQCGIACLQMICKYYGKEYTLARLSELCFATNEGVSMLGISQAAEKLELHTVCGRATTDQLGKVQLPCIVYWNQNHFVILYKVKKTRKGCRYYVADPGKGRVEYTEKEFKDGWLSTQSKGEEKGVAMFLNPTPAFESLNDVAEEHKGQRSFSFLFGYIKQHKKYFGQILLGLIVGCLIQLAMPFLTQAIVDVGITHQNLTLIWLILLGQLVLTISRTTVDFIRRWLLLHISMRINISLVSDFFIKLLKLPMSFFDTKLMGDLLQRMADHKRVEQFLTTQTLSVMFSLLSFVVFGIVLFFYDWLIFVLFLGGSILYGGWIAMFLSRRKVLDYELFEKQAVNNTKTYQFITSMQEIKLQDCEQRRRWEWEDVQADLFDVQMKSLKLQQQQEAGSIFINEAKNIVITVVAAAAVIQGSMTLGMMLAVQYIIGQLNSPVEQLMKFLYSLQDVKISLERINEIHNIRNEESPERRLTVLNKEDKDLKFENVSFKYDPHNPQWTLEGINFTIPYGKTTAIVGASGSGKTTLLKLMLGYYPVPQGEVKIGNTNLDHFDLKWWRRQCGVVMQDGVIFSENIGQNIAVDDGEMSFDRLKRAVELANVKTFVERMPLKYSTQIGPDGVGLSQGQKQRILIARAIYKNPQYIFLDEATNALDAENERVIVENLHDFYLGRTVVVVAHRLSTVKDADQIIVMDKGRIVETGDHASLIRKQGAYYNLVKNQLELGN
ncbi:peptidase domain-containing ABC transporter [Bacteroides fluxus]|uniref:ABC transporter, ATP-binding protein n=1 Tax=Bacteroides fluxus YIT 12057 TaxID=763034 RepID=F3PT54_9BACE|nr:peptidase domain-containing ABC transporter [Bacteroides fluxus]EGF57072.1 ABC transporter, ATP-binding protein [Bacteroides fluxus YIT 12057]